LFTDGRFRDIDPELSTTNCDRDRQVGVLKADQRLLHPVLADLKSSLFRSGTSLLPSSTVQFSTTSSTSVRRT
jgi:hypothetical protein